MSNDPFVNEEFDAEAKNWKENKSVSSEGKIVLTFKQSGGYDAPWVVIHAADAADAKRQLKEVSGEGLFGEVSSAASVFAGTKAGPTAPPAAPQRSQNNGGFNQAEGDFGPVQSCQHGQKSVIEGRYGPFWACPAQRDDPSKCKAQKAYKK